MELLYTITSDVTSRCPPTDKEGIKVQSSTCSQSSCRVQVDLKNVDFDGSRVDLYVRVWRSHGDVNGACSKEFKLHKAGMYVCIYIHYIAITVTGVCLQCPWILIYCDSTISTYLCIVYT